MPGVDAQNGGGQVGAAPGDGNGDCNGAPCAGVGNAPQIGRPLDPLRTPEGLGSQVYAAPGGPQGATEQVGLGLTDGPLTALTPPSPRTISEDISDSDSGCCGIEEVEPMELPVGFDPEMVTADASSNAVAQIHPETTLYILQSVSTSQPVESSPVDFQVSLSDAAKDCLKELKEAFAAYDRSHAPPTKQPGGLEGAEAALYKILALLVKCKPFIPLAEYEGFRTMFWERERLYLFASGGLKKRGGETFAPGDAGGEEEEPADDEQEDEEKDERRKALIERVVTVGVTDPRTGEYNDSGKEVNASPGSWKYDVGPCVLVISAPIEAPKPSEPLPLPGQGTWALYCPDDWLTPVKKGMYGSTRTAQGVTYTLEGFGPEGGSVGFIQGKDGTLAHVGGQILPSDPRQVSFK